MKKTAGLFASTVWLILISFVSAQQPLTACGIASHNLSMAPSGTFCVMAQDCHVADVCESGTCYGASACPNCSDCIGFWQWCSYYMTCGLYSMCSNTAMCA